MDTLGHVACNAGEAWTERSRRDQAKKGGCRTGRTRTEGHHIGVVMGSKAASGDEDIAGVVAIGSTGSVVWTK